MKNRSRGKDLDRKIRKIKLHDRRDKSYLIYKSKSKKDTNSLNLNPTFKYLLIYFRSSSSHKFRMIII